MIAWAIIKARPSWPSQGEPATGLAFRKCSCRIVNPSQSPAANPYIPSLGGYLWEPTNVTTSTKRLSAAGETCLPGHTDRHRPRQAAGSPGPPHRGRPTRALPEPQGFNSWLLPSLPSNSDSTIVREARDVRDVEFVPSILGYRRNSTSLMAGRQVHIMPVLISIVDHHTRLH